MYIHPQTHANNICFIVCAFTIIWHSEDGDLSNGAISAFHSASTLIDGSQISVHVARKATTARHFLAGSRDLQVIETNNMRVTRE